jgi:hypothetical protein
MSAPAKGKKPAGRPTGYTEAKADSICEHIAHGKSLVSWCREHEEAYRTVMEWLAANEPFQHKYARAREAQADFLAEEILEIADDTSFDTSEGPGGALVANNEWISRSRLRVDARKWYAGKLAPKKYGDKLAVGGADDLPPLQGTLNINAAGLSLDQLRALASIPVQSS